MYRLTVPAVIILFVACIQLAFAAILVMQNRKRGERELAAVVLSLFFYSLGTGFNYMASSQEAMAIWMCLGNVGMPFLPFTLVRFISSYYNLSFTNSRLIHYFCAGFGFLIMVLQFTSSFHSFLYSDIVFSKMDGFSTLSMTPRLLYHLYWLFQIIASVTFIYVSLYMMLRGRRAYRKRGILLILAVLIPILADTAFLTGKNGAAVDPLPFAFILSTGILMYLHLSDSLFQPVPVENRHILSSLLDGIMLLDQKGIILDYNSKIREYIPEIEERHIGMDLVKAVSEVALLGEFTGEPMNQKEGEAFHVEIRKEDGSSSFYEVRKFSVRNRPARKVSSLVIRDVSEQHRISVELKDRYDTLAEAEKLKSMVIDVMSRDLRSPMMMMKGLRQLMSSDLVEQNPTVWKQSGIELDGLIDRADSLISNLLTLNLSFEREEAYPVGAVDVESVFKEIHEALIRYALKKQVSYILEVEDEVLVHANHELLKHVLRNIIENGIKYSRAGDEVRARVLIGYAEVKVIVEDRGTTIDRETLKAFEQGRWAMANQGTSAEQGPGIGLFAARRFMDIQGGSLVVQQRNRGGTRVTVTLKRVLSDPAGITSAGRNPIAGEG